MVRVCCFSVVAVTDLSAAMAAEDGVGAHWAPAVAHWAEVAWRVIWFLPDVCECVISRTLKREEVMQCGMNAFFV